MTSNNIFSYLDLHPESTLQDTEKEFPDYKKESVAKYYKKWKKKQNANFEALKEEGFVCLNKGQINRLIKMLSSNEEMTIDMGNINALQKKLPDPHVQRNIRLSKDYKEMLADVAHKLNVSERVAIHAAIELLFQQIFVNEK